MRSVRYMCSRGDPLRMKTQFVLTLGNSSATNVCYVHVSFLKSFFFDKGDSIFLEPGKRFHKNRCVPCIYQNTCAICAIYVRRGVFSIEKTQFVLTLGNSLKKRGVISMFHICFISGKVSETFRKPPPLIEETLCASRDRGDSFCLDPGILFYRRGALETFRKPPSLTLNPTTSTPTPSTTPTHKTVQ